MIFVLPEIDPEVDFDSRRAVYFRQMRYGLFVCSIPLLPYQALKDFFSLDPDGATLQCVGIILEILDSNGSDPKEFRIM